MKTLVLFIVFVSACATTPTRWERPFLYRIETTPPSYLLGTMHIPDRRLFPLPDSLQRVLAKVRIVECEVDFDGLAQELSRNLETLFFAYPQTIEPLLTPEETAALRRIVEADNGDWSRARRLKPWAMTFSTQGSAPKASPAAATSLDYHLFREGKKRGLQVGAIESLPALLDLMDAQPLADQLKDLRDLIDRRTGKTRVPREAWRDLLSMFFRGDLDKLAGYLVKESAWSRDETEKRNLGMTMHIVNRLREGRAALFAVGALHLPGEKGVLADLRDQGFDVTRVK